VRFDDGLHACQGRQAREVGSRAAEVRERGAKSCSALVPFSQEKVEKLCDTRSIKRALNSPLS